MINYLNPDFNDLPGRKSFLPGYRRGLEKVEHSAVSIITPYNNQASLFIETFNSLQSQSLQNWEWIIVEDQVTDAGAKNCLAKVVANDLRIKVVKHLKSATASALRIGLQHSTGRYVCYLRSSDMIEPTYLEKCIWFLDSNQEFSFCNSYSVILGEKNYLETTGLQQDEALLKSQNIPPILLFRRTASMECGGFSDSTGLSGDDQELWLTLARAGHWGYTISEYLQWHRKAGGVFTREDSESDRKGKVPSKRQIKPAVVNKRFPRPSRRRAASYETLLRTSDVINPLASSPSGGRRILFILPWMVTGGADRMNLDLIEGLTSKGVDVTACITLKGDHPWADQYYRLTPDIFVLPNVLRPVDYPRFLAYLIQSRRIETVLIVGSTLGYQLLPYLRATSPGVAFLDLCHVEEPHWMNGGHPRFGVGYQDVLDLNVVSTRHLSEWMQERGADSSRIRVLYSGIRTAQLTRPTEVRAQLRLELNLPIHLPVIVFAGRLCEQKRPALLAEILKAARDSGLKFRALILGEGELRGPLEVLLNRYQLTEVVQMLGSVSHARWLEVLVASDLFLMPSQYEGISIALLEAMAAGVVPVVACVGGQGEITRGLEAFVIPHGPTELQDYLTAISRLITDSAELRHFSQHCKALAQSNHSWEGMIENCESIFNEAHRLRVEQPRNPISPNFGRELVSQAFECNRLGESAGWIGNVDSDESGAETNALAVAKLALRLGQTRMGRLLLNSYLFKLIKKRWVGKFSGSGAT